MRSAPEILWHNSTTQNSVIWSLSGERIVRRSDVVDERGVVIPIGPPWSIVATADFDHDGNADILWQNSSDGEVQIWFMNGEHIVRRANVVDEHGTQIRAGAPWSIAGVAAPLAPPPPPPPVPDSASFGATGMTCALALGGDVHLFINKQGDFAFTTHAHDSGLTNIDYTIVGVLSSATRPELAISFTHQGGVEGELAALPFGEARRNDDLNSTGNNPLIRDEWANLVNGSFAGRIDGTDALLNGVEGLLEEAAKAAAAKLGEAAATALVAIVG
jgi:hypothetical protein